jgi:sugar transferase (PEP-CTERM/EpsH1 system associated)
MVVFAESRNAPRRPPVHVPATSTVSEAPALGRVLPTFPIRVMHVLYRLHAGGMEYGVVKLANALDRGRVETTICSTVPATELKAHLDPAIPVFELHRRAGNDPAVVWHLYRLLRRERPDILHTHAWGTLCEGLVAGRLAGVPVIVHGEHGTLQTGPWQVRAQRWAWAQVDQVLSVSSRLAQRMSERIGFPADRIRTIRNGVDLSRFLAADRQRSRAQLGIGAGELVIGTAGRLVDVKDQRTFVSAVAMLRARGVECSAVIAGEGPLRAALERQIRHSGLEAHVRLLGHRSDLPAVLAALDVFVLSSLSEGLSNTILEAMAAGLPVVSTRVGGADELVDEGRTGLLVPAEDPAALTDAIAGLCTDDTRRARMGRAARERAQHTFSLARMVADYEDLYVRYAGDSRVVRRRLRADAQRQGTNR